MRGYRLVLSDQYITLLFTAVLVRLLGLPNAKGNIGRLKCWFSLYDFCVKSVVRNFTLSILCCFTSFVTWNWYFWKVVNFSFDSWNVARCARFTDLLKHQLNSDQKRDTSCVSWKGLNCKIFSGDASQALNTIYILYIIFPTSKKMFHNINKKANMWPCLFLPFAFCTQLSSLYIFTGLFINFSFWWPAD